MKRPKFHRDTFFALLSTLFLAFVMVWSRVYLRSTSAILSILALCVAAPVFFFSLCASVTEWIMSARRAPLTRRMRSVFRAALLVCMIVFCVLVVQSGMKQGRVPVLTWRSPASLCFGLVGIGFVLATCETSD